MTKFDIVFSISFTLMRKKRGGIAAATTDPYIHSYLYDCQCFLSKCK